MMTQRINWIDIFKGLIITTIVIGHSGSPVKIYNLVYSFHVAAFLFISGYTFKAQKDLNTIVIDRAKRLLLPYFAYDFLYFGLYVATSYFKVREIFYGSGFPFHYFSRLQLILWAPLGGVNWFLWTLFETTICSAILIKVTQKYSINYLFLCIPIVGLFSFGLNFSYILYHPHFLLFPAFDVNFAAIPYFLLGFLARQYKVFNRKQLLLYSTPALILAIYFFAWKYDASISIGSRDLKHWPYSIPTSLAAFGCLFSLSVLADLWRWSRRLLVLIGKRTLPILCLHLLGFKLIVLLLYEMGICPAAFLSFYQPSTQYFWILLTALSIIFCLNIAALIEHSSYLSFFFLGSSSKSNVEMKNIKLIAPETFAQPAVGKEQIWS